MEREREIERKGGRETEEEEKKGVGVQGGKKNEKEGLSSWFGFPPPRNCKDDPGGRRTNVCGRTSSLRALPHLPSAFP